MARLTKTEERARERLSYYMWKQSEAENLTTALRDEVPEAWHVLEHDLPVREKKVQVTLRLDESVAKFYRAMGQGWHARVNTILGSWAQMKIAKALEADKMLTDRWMDAHMANHKKWRAEVQAERTEKGLPRKTWEDTDED